jgi:hypothetical protein
VTPHEPLGRPLPTPDADSAALWDGLRRGKLLLQHCRACGHAQYYQQAACRACGSDALEHRPASGRGRVHSFSVVHRAPGPEFASDTPYAVILVELQEGPRMISRMTNCDPNTVDFDMEVELVCVAVTDEVTLPYFAPIPVA